MVSFLLSQAQNIERDIRGRRWPKEIISTSLELFNRSPKGYDLLRQSDMFILPSPSLLILYKNTVKQKPGFQEEVFKWMFAEAERLRISPEGRKGGFS